MIKKALLLLVGLSAASPLYAQGPEPSLADRARGAGRVVVAQVVDVQSRFGTNRFGDQLILSTLVLDVEETLKGPAGRTLNVEIEGGTVGGARPRAGPSR